MSFTRALEEASGGCAIKRGGGLARSKFTTMALRFEFKSYPLSLLAVAHVRHSCSAYVIPLACVGRQTRGLLIWPLFYAVAVAFYHDQLSVMASNSSSTE